jgi:hypothetical protein
MKARTTVLTMLLCSVGVAVCLADASMMGTWKLNEAQSKFGPGATKNSTVIYEAADDSVRVTVEGTDSKGQATHSEWTGKFDGKDYPVTGEPTAATRSYRKINDRTLTFMEKSDGKVTLTGRIVISADSKSRTVTTTATDAKGMKVTSTAVYDKQ